MVGSHDMFRWVIEWDTVTAAERFANAVAVNHACLFHGTLDVVRQEYLVVMVGGLDEPNQQYAQSVLADALLLSH